MKRSSIKFEFDPFKLVAEVTKDLYPGIQAKICFGASTGKKKEYGCTVFGTTVPTVLISPKTPMFAAPEILAHELAHVAAGPKAGHGRKWERAFSKIHREYTKRIFALAKKTGLTLAKPDEKKAA